MHALLLCLPLALQGSPAIDPHGPPPVRAPFEGLDRLCVDDWWNRPPSPILDPRVPRDRVVAFGLYTVADRTLKLTAQLFPLYPDETRTVRLEIEREGRWIELAARPVDDLGWATTFRVEGWSADRDVRYRLRHGARAVFEGLVRAAPPIDRPFVLAALSCNSNRDRGPRTDVVRAVRSLDPDLVFFAGDQSYDHREHTAAWLAFGLQFRDLFRDRPCITLPDDHDVGQPNLWGEAGGAARLPGAADGGYLLGPDYVRMVERAQTAHLPDPFDPTPVGQGIGVWYTRLVLGPVDLALVEDRKFKTGPAGVVPQFGPRPDHVRDPGYDPEALDVEGLELLGERQHAFLRAWADDRGAAPFRLVLSQTGFAGAAHLHGSRDGRLLADLDSNGWPRSGRDEALRLIRDAGAIHVAGDQHLATVVQHGIEAFRDGPWAFVVPAVVNDYYGRWWWPEDERAGPGADPDAVLPWTGDHFDGFGNRFTMHAYANPESPAGGAGFGIVRLDPASGTASFECWPRGVDPTAPGAAQFAGWPITVRVR